MFARFHAKLSNQFDRPKTAPPMVFPGSGTAKSAAGERERDRRRVVSLQLTCAAVDAQDSPCTISVQDYTPTARRQSGSAAPKSTAGLLGHASAAPQPAKAPAISHSAALAALPGPPAGQRWSDISKGQPRSVTSLTGEEPNALGLYEPLVRASPAVSFSSSTIVRPGELRATSAAAETTPSSTLSLMAAAPRPTAPDMSTSSPIGHAAASRSHLKRMRSTTPVPEHPALHPQSMTSTAVAPSTKSGGGRLFDGNHNFDRHVKFRAGTKETDGVPRTKAARRARISREKMSMEKALADEDAVPTQTTSRTRARPATAVQFQPQPQPQLETRPYSRLQATLPSSSQRVAAPPSPPHSVDAGGQALSAYGTCAREVDRAPFVPAKLIPRGYAPERGWTAGAGAQTAPMVRYSETQTDWQQQEARMAVHIVSDVHGAETLHDWMAGARYAYAAGVPVSGRT